jgi:type I restriction enzyme S subunit
MQTVKIRDLGRIITGSTPPTANPAFYGSRYLFIKPSDLSVGQRRVCSTETTLSAEGGRHLGSKLLPRNTTCVVCIGTIGKLGLTSEPCFTNQQLNSVIVDTSRYDPIYVFYLLSTIIPQLQQIQGGSASGREHVNKTNFENIEVRVHPLEDQNRIASILSSYDDLIENNTQRIKIIEEMAQMLYREWFVNFRFPGHEKVLMGESALGPIPEGWSARCVTEAVLVNPATKVSKDGVKPFLPMGSLSENSMLITEVEERVGNSGSKFMNGDTLFARITPCLENGKTGFVQFLPSDDAAAFGSTEFIVLRSKTVCPEYVYLMARSSEFRDNAIKSMCGATGRQRIQEACFGRFFIAESDKGTLEHFQSIASPMFRLIHSLSLKNDNLGTTRDLLLPKLLSGEIPVEAVEELVEETA